MLIAHFYSFMDLGRTIKYYIWEGKLKKKKVSVFIYWKINKI